MPLFEDNSSKLSRLSDDEVLMEAEIQRDLNVAIDPVIFRQIAERGLIDRLHHRLAVERLLENPPPAINPDAQLTERKS